ncbi:hypothetical protein C0Q70_02523 [Pomacea canaliculata]|uniref:Uncharacterized protein n=1 Tax=Pomacea canaliculata TaxID=400727 RepID=A0A2T7PQ89_POMCA|nr:hypothetical protein C0Q70_02523 [Pomacea canaliculata]
MPPTPPTRNVLFMCGKHCLSQVDRCPSSYWSGPLKVKNRHQEQRLRVMVLTGRRTPVGQIQVGRGRSGTSTQVIGHRYSMAGPQHSPGTHDTLVALNLSRSPS